MTEVMIAVDGGEVWTDDSGGDGAPLVLLHPGIGDSRSWEPVLPALAASYRVIRYDARGFGRSPAPTAKFSLLADLISVLGYYGLDRAAFVGCSQGGGSALGLTLEQPARVSALVLLCPGIPGYPWPEEPDELDAEYERALEAGDADALADLLQRIWAGAGPTPEVMEQLRSGARAEVSSGDMQQEDPPVYGRLGEISVPTSLLVGDADYPPLIQANREAAARIQGCELTVVPGMDHLPPLREPGLVLRTITSTLARAGWLHPGRYGSRCRRADRAGSPARRAGRPGPAVPRHPLCGIPGHRGPVRGTGRAGPLGRIRDALSYGATSPQPDRGVTLIPEPIIAGDNELNLNVFTPDLGPARLPVLVWIHGGGFFGGCNASPWYRGGPFARDGVVLVSINYRLGAEGFLEVPSAPANRAVRDWVRALEWVQENIAAFGGDPGLVTIAGQSAGGAACAALLGVPAARGLFRGAACMSGGSALMQTADGVRAVAARMAGRLGVPALDRAALEQMPAGTILAAQEAVTAAGPGAHDVEALAALLGRGITLPWAPWPDGDVVTEEPLRAAASPRHREVTLLAGATAHEFNMAWIPADWITADMAAEGLARAGVAAPLAAAYLGQAGPRPSAAVGQAVTDRTFRVPAQRLAMAKAEAGGSAWTYDFRWAPPAGPLAGLAFHCLDVPFFFDALGEPGVAEAAGPAPPGALAADMHGAMVRFVTDGAPGWAPHGAGRRPVMAFGDPSGVQEDPLGTELSVWT